MTGYEAATLYAGLFVLLFLTLKLNTGRVRASAKISVGHGDNDALHRAMRVQGNAIEDVPVTVIGLFGLAALSAPTLLVHILGGGFFVFRVLHAVGLGGSTGTGLGRMIGTLGSAIVMLVTGGACVWFALA